eukprot:589379-Rhodomonas_salina.3
MPAEKIPTMLGRVFLDFGHEITMKHAQDFLAELGKDRTCAVLHWHEVYKVLRDHRMGTNKIPHGPFIGSAFNPLWPMLHKWRAFVYLCAIYYLIMVPARIAFLPFDTPVAQGALASDLLVDVIVTLDLLIRLNTAHRTHKATWSTNRLKILRKVPIPAIIAGLPIDWFAHLLTASNEVVCWLRWPRMLLIFAMQGGRKRMTSPQMEDFVKMCKLVGLLLHWTCCCWYYLGRVYSFWVPDSAVSWTHVDDDYRDLTFDREEVYGLDEDASVWSKVSRRCAFVVVGCNS